MVINGLVINRLQDPSYCRVNKQHLEKDLKQQTIVEGQRLLQCHLWSVSNSGDGQLQSNPTASLLHNEGWAHCNMKSGSSAHRGAGCSIKNKTKIK